MGRNRKPITHKIAEYKPNKKPEKANRKMQKNKGKKIKNYTTKKFIFRTENHRVTDTKNLSWIPARVGFWFQNSSGKNHKIKNF